MFIERKCPHFVFQNDRNGEFAIGICGAMHSSEQEHEGNYACYSCPKGEKNCFTVVSMGSTPPLPQEVK